MKDMDKECNNCKWFVDCINPLDLSVCPEWDCNNDVRMGMSSCVLSKNNTLTENTDKMVKDD